MSIQTLVEKIKEKGNPTVAGLDARLEYIPQHISGRNMMLHGETLRAAAESVVAFNCGLIDALCDIVPAVKPQAAYYELLGSYGAMALKETIDYAHAKGMYVIGDIKRNDIGATASAYAEAYLGKTRVGDTEIAPYGCDSVTVNGYLVPQPREEPVPALQDLEPVLRRASEPRHGGQAALRAHG